MHKYAITEIAGYQFRIEDGAKITVPRLDIPVGDTLSLDKMLLISDEGKVSVGSPFVDGAKAQAKVLEHNRSKKVLVFKKKRRKGFRKKATSRRYQTVLEISGISL